MTRKRSKPAAKRTKAAPKASPAPEIVAPPIAAPAEEAPAQPMGSFEEAVALRASVKARLDKCEPSDMAKYIDAYSRIANVVRQLEKDRKRALGEFTDDEVGDYLRGLPDRRRDAILIAVQGSSLAGKPLF